jgi:hypothetical protein
MRRKSFIIQSFSASMPAEEEQGEPAVDSKACADALEATLTARPKEQEGTLHTSRKNIKGRAIFLDRS